MESRRWTRTCRGMSEGQRSSEYSKYGSIHNWDTFPRGGGSVIVIRSGVGRTSNYKLSACSPVPFSTLFWTQAQTIESYYYNRHQQLLDTFTVNEGHAQEY